MVMRGRWYIQTTEGKNDVEILVVAHDWSVFAGLEELKLVTTGHGSNQNLGTI